MKPLFQSRPLHLTACILLFWKGISIIILLLLQGVGDVEYFFSSTGFASAFGLLAAAAFSDSRTLSIIFLAGLCIASLAYWVLFALLAINRSSAGFASVGLVVLCVLDLPMTVACSFSQWWSILVCIIFHAAIFITIALLRRSRPGFSLVLSKIPESI